MSKFIELADFLFSDECNYTVSEFHNKYADKFPRECGLYTVIKPNNIDFTINDTSSGPSSYRGILLALKPEEDYNKYINGNKKYLYIGKAGGKNGIAKRLGSYISFGYATGNTDIRHRGGFSLWFLEDNKEMLVSYITIADFKEKCPNLYKAGVEIYNQAKTMYVQRNNKALKYDEAEILEACLTELHKNNYKGLLPFANCTRENTIIEYKTLWSKYWRSV